jgi:hypothetical protein
MLPPMGQVHAGTLRPEPLTCLWLTQPRCSHTNDGKDVHKSESLPKNRSTLSVLGTASPSDAH